jgi:hypothetical protein
MFKTILLLVPVLVANAASPLTANFSRKISHYQPDGSLTLADEQHGTFSRNSQGDEALVLPSQSTISKHGEGTSYFVRTASKSYYKIAWTTQAQGAYGTMAAQELAKGAKGQTINGVYCVTVTTYGGDHVPSGSMCISPDLGIVVKREMDLWMNGKIVNHWVEEMDTVQFTEPNAALFQVPAGFKEVASPAQCSTCAK